MKTGRTVLFATALILSSASALGGGPGQSLDGMWYGQGEAMYVDGTMATIVEVNAQLQQQGNFFYGMAEFEVMIGMGPDTMIQGGQISGYLEGNKLKGVLGGCMTMAPDCLGAAILEGKISGNKVTGTVIDFSDGSTSTVTMFRLRD